ncbi:MAG: hypothetical protein IMY76_07690 [Chloroflexi bacterium]|nr:hypothetical protein [Chloroflexota bacterium]
MKQLWLLIIFVLGIAMLTISCGIDLSTFNNNDFIVREQTSIVTGIPLNEPLTIPELTVTIMPEITSSESESENINIVPSNATIDDATSETQNAEIIAFRENYIYAVQLGSPVAMPNWSHTELGCNLVAVAGQVFGQDGAPELGIIIETGGSIGEQTILGLSVTGVIDLYGPGSYEIHLADHTVSTQGDIWIQIKGTSGEVLSPKIYFDTYEDCDKNLILMNFVKVEPYSIYKVFLPWIIHEAP